MWKFISISIGLASWVLALMMGTKPHEAASNLSAWLEKLGVTAPDFLIHPQIDKWATAFFIIVGIISMFSPSIYRRFRVLNKGKGSAQSTAKDTKLITRDTPMRDALAYIVTRIWGSTQADIEIEQFGYAIREMNQAATDGIVTIWGAKQKNGRLIEIPTKYWEDWQLEILSVFYSDGVSTELATLPKINNDKYYDLMISKAQVEQKWPPKK